MTLASLQQKYMNPQLLLFFSTACIHSTITWG